MIIVSGSLNFIFECLETRDLCKNHKQSLKVGAIARIKMANLSVATSLNKIMKL